METIHLSGFRKELEKVAFGGIIRRVARFGTRLLGRAPVNEVATQTLNRGQRYVKNLKSSVAGAGTSAEIAGLIGIGGLGYGALSQPASIKNIGHIKGRYSI